MTLSVKRFIITKINILALRIKYKNTQHKDTLAYLPSLFQKRESFRRMNDT
jgi:hypothetical protein